MSITQEILTKYKNLTIKSGEKSYSFPAFLEDSDIIYDLKEQSLPFAPVSFTNDSMALRVLEKVKFTFNVFSHNEGECLENWKKFVQLREIIKPRYFMVSEQLVPNIENVTGFIEINFSGMPHGRHKINIHLTNFSYSLNKELGYLESKEALIPIGFKISIEGKVLLPLGETISVQNLVIEQNNNTITTTAASTAGAASAPTSSPSASQPAATAPAATARTPVKQNTKTRQQIETSINVTRLNLLANRAITVDSTGRVIANTQVLQNNPSMNSLYQRYLNLTASLK